MSPLCHTQTELNWPRKWSLAGSFWLHGVYREEVCWGTIQRKHLRVTNCREKLSFSAVVAMALADLSESSEPGLAQSRSKLHERARPFKSYISQPLDAAARGDVSMTLGSWRSSTKDICLRERLGGWLLPSTRKNDGGIISYPVTSLEVRVPPNVSHCQGF